MIRPLCAGHLMDQDVSNVLYQRRAGEKADFPCIIFVIEVGGRKILFDTGPSHPERAEAFHMPLRRDAGMDPALSLPRIGVDPDRVDLVIMSHLHWDHCGNNHLFPNATFLVQKAELQHAIAPNVWQNTQYETATRKTAPLWFDSFKQMEIIEGDRHDLVTGVHLIHLPGHTPGLMGAAVETRKGVHMIASDAVPWIDNWEGDARAKHIPSTIHTNLDDCARSFKKIEEIADVVLASHDNRTLRHGVYPVLDG
ncbi:MAG: N-acyl homoserine lactonase family protein [Alphaproteobacteria bacterium]|nr:N-acyl homoserine lactonase family protein [Alphaproteobacteria bacterium]